MEPAKIDWNSLESVFVVDRVYENINAPQWVDFLAPQDHSPDEDDAWFCRPDCKHPKTAQDFLKSTPTPKLLRSVSVSKLIGLGDWTRREGNLKRRGPGQGQSCEDSENENPNFLTPNHRIKAFKETIKSSAQTSTQEEDDEYSEILLHSDEKPRSRLRSTQSARDLFGGRDIFNKITELCNELKKMTGWAKEREAEEAAKICSKKEGARDVLGSHSEKKMDQRDKERRPFLELTKDRCEAGERNNAKKKLRKKKVLDDGEGENIPISLDLNLKDIKRKEEERLLPIRTNPPTPQGFSASREHSKNTPSKGPKSRLKEREIFQEVEQQNTKTLREELGDKSHTKNASPIAGREGRALDVFWFLKPCTLSS